MKKLISVSLAVLMMVLCAIPVFAADMNADEQRVLDAASAVVKVDGKMASIPEDILNQLELFLLRNNVDLSKEQADYVIGKINACFAIVQQKGVAEVETIRDMAFEDRRQLLTLAQEAGEKVGLDITYDVHEKKMVFREEATGELITTTGTTIKFTGADTTLWAIVAAGMLALIAGGAFAAKKAGLFA